MSTLTPPPNQEQEKDDSSAIAPSASSSDKSSTFTISSNDESSVSLTATAAAPSTSQYINTTYTLDTLTDGSEGTGDGTLFLSVWKQSIANPTTIRLSPSDKPCACYAIQGLGDGTSRLAADRQYKLGSVRAVFVPYTNHCGLWGIPSWTCAARAAGVAQVHVVAPNATRIEQFLQSVEGRRPYPSIALCQLPPPKEPWTTISGTTQQGDTNATTWWYVYQDDYLLVHAQSYPLNTSNNTVDTRPKEYAAVYLYTLLQYPQCPSLLLLPFHIPPSVVASFVTQVPGNHNIPQANRPVYNNQVLHERWIVRIGHCHTVRPNTASPPGRVTQWYCTRPDSLTLDRGLLVRAQAQARAWHAQHPALLPWNASSDNDVDEYDDNGSGERNDAGDNNHGTRKHLSSPSTPTLAVPVAASPHCLDSGSTVFLSPHSTPDRHHCDHYELWSRNVANLDTSFDLPSDYRVQWSVPNVTTKDTTTCDAHVPTSDKDANEIDLEELDPDDSSAFDTKDNDTHSCPHPVNPPIRNGNVVIQRMPCLLVLGTGCAAPSPCRGASGYALVLDDYDAIALEAGEGFVMQWHRHAQGRPLSVIRTIWISHAHWDHYGGLVPLIQAIYNDRQKQQESCHTPRDSTTESAKRPRPLSVLTVIAPRAVLRVVDSLLDRNPDMYRGYALESPETRNMFSMHQIMHQKYGGQVVYWHNVLVDHSCRSAYGCVMALQLNGDTRPYVIAFSGDTRPCRRFVKACHQACEYLGVHRQQVDLLIHEATFDVSEQAMSVAKMHSTFPEALQVSRDVRSARTLLTHFSQRYDNLQILSHTLSNLRDDRYPHEQVVLALDGQCLPLL
jgi:ribonuclease BN (tRNA processing enzyme)